jgi:hypothetical protein
MAKSFEKQLDDAIDEISKNFNKAAQKAVAVAAEKTTDVIYDKALSCLKEYYKSYRPTSYDRTNTLVWSFVKDFSVKPKGSKITCDMGIIYDPTRLDGFYWKNRGDGYNSYQEPDSQWVIDNYLDGIHPTTTGGATMQYGLNYAEERDEKSPEYRMKMFLEWKAIQEFKNWYYVSLYEQVVGLIK